MNEIDKLDGMVKIKGKCGYEFIGGCKDLRTAKQKLEKIEELCKNQDILRGRQALASTILKIIWGEEW